MLNKIPEKWDEQADVIVVGYGGAGAVTAITAHDVGAKVLILEKASKGEEGGNTAVSGNIWVSVEPTEDAFAYIRGLCQDYTIPEEMVRVWAAEMGKNNEWVRSMGGEPVEMQALSREFPDVPGTKCVHVYKNGPIDRATEGSKTTLWQLLERSVQKREIKILYSTPATRLIQNPANEIIGVAAKQGARDITVRARRAVVLTCGGFENNSEMIKIT